MDTKCLIYSIIMPTFNSERTLDEALNAIRSQNFNQDEIEILVVDGGSTDNTRKIAEKYNCIIIDNPERLPEPAKKYGMMYAKGKYVCIMGSDEILTEKNQLLERYQILEKHPDIHCLICSLYAPKDYAPLCAYINAVGDPFTCFVYQTYSNKISNLRKNLYKKDGHAYIFKFAPDDITPIGDGGTVLDLEFIRKNYEKEADELESSLLFDIVLRDTKYLIILDNDWVKHLSKADFKTYLNKVKFRVVNNIHDVEKSGFANRAQIKQKLNRRKYLYPIYCLTIIWPLMDSIKMCINFKNKVFMCHFIFTYYVMIQVIYEYAKKIFGKKSTIPEYGK